MAATRACVAPGLPPNIGARNMGPMRQSASDLTGKCIQFMNSTRQPSSGKNVIIVIQLESLLVILQRGVAVSSLKCQISVGKVQKSNAPGKSRSTATAPWMPSIS